MVSKVSNKLLLIIDMQEGFLSPEAEIIISPILRLAKFFEEEGDEIALVKFINSPKSWFATRLDWTDFQDTADQRILKELEVAKGFVVYHDTYTVLNQDLQEYISKIPMRGFYGRLHNQNRHGPF